MAAVQSGNNVDAQTGSEGAAATDSPEVVIRARLARTIGSTLLTATVVGALSVFLALRPEAYWLFGLVTLMIALHRLMLLSQLLVMIGTKTVLSPDGLRYGRTGSVIFSDWSNISGIELVKPRNRIVGITFVDLKAIHIDTDAGLRRLLDVVMRAPCALIIAWTAVFSLQPRLLKYLFVGGDRAALSFNHELLGHHLLIPDYLADRPLDEVLALLHDYCRRHGEHAAASLPAPEASKETESAPHPPLADQPATLEIRPNLVPQAVFTALGALIPAGLLATFYLLPLALYGFLGLGPPSPDLSSEVVVVVGVLLGFGVLLGWWQLARPQPVWQLSPEGLTARGIMGELTVPWREIESFYVKPASFRKHVCARMRTTQHVFHPSKRLFQQVKSLAGGSEVLIKQSGLDRSAEDFIKAAESFLAAFGSIQAESGRESTD